MFNWIRKNQTLALVFILMVCFSFVAFFTSGSIYDLFTGTGNVNYGSINGRPIEEDEFLDAYQETRLTYLFRFGQWPSGSDARRFGFDLETEARNRLFITQKLRELGISPDEASVAKWIVESGAFSEEGQFKTEYYDRFVKEILPTKRMNSAVFKQFAENEVGLQHLMEVVGTSGELISPMELKTLFTEENRQVKVASIFFSTADHLAKVDINPDAVARYYTNTMASYRNPEKRSVSYVSFEATNFWFDASVKLEEMTTLQERIDTEYSQQDPESFKDAEGNILSQEEARNRIKDQIQEAEALKLARLEAIQFGQELLALEPVEAGNLEKLAAAKGYLANTSEPFARNAGPTEISDARSQIATATFNLTAETPFSTPILGNKGVYIVALKDIVPSQVPDLAEIRDRVTMDFRRSQAASAVRMEGSAFRSRLNQALESGQTLEAFCETESKEVVEIPPFSQSDSFISNLDPRFDLRQAQRAAFEMNEGELSNFISTSSGGFLFVLKEKLPVAPEKFETELPEFADQIRNRRKIMAFNEWYRKIQENANIMAPVTPETLESDEPPAPTL